MDSATATAARVRLAWSSISAPPADDLKYLAWACGEEAWRALVDIAPVDVDITSPGVLGCTPLLDLPPRAAAAYLGTYVLLLLRGLEYQEKGGVFHDVITRAHVLYCLGEPTFWQRVIRPHLPSECQRSLAEVCAYLGAHRELVGVPDEQIDRMIALSMG